MDISRAALIIVDVQNDFCEGGALEVPNGRWIIPAINAISPHFGTVVATKDWHPATHVSFAATHNKQFGDTIETAHGVQQLWPAHCVQHTDGAKLHRQLNVEPLTLVLHKGVSPQRDSYSGFVENDKQTSTGLAGYLQERQVADIFVCGLACEYCVMNTAIDGVAKGFKVAVVRDATAAIDGNDEQRAIQQMQSTGISFVESSVVTAP